MEEIIREIYQAEESVAVEGIEARN
jgi:hypothetical protein